MKITSMRWLYAVALIGLLAAGPVSTAEPAATGKGEGSPSQGASQKTVYLLFYRRWDASAQAMFQVVKRTADKHATRATWKTVSISDSAAKTVVDQFRVGRAPMPLVLAVHPNGAVTGAYVRKVVEADLAGSLVSPKKAECVKLLQQNRLVLLCVQRGLEEALPRGVQEFLADPRYAKRAQAVTVHGADPNEKAFFAELKIDPQTQAPLTVFMAPPGVMVGKFSPAVGKHDLAAALEAAGKCCDDPNCKHDHR